MTDLLSLAALTEAFSFAPSARLTRISTSRLGTLAAGATLATFLTSSAFASGAAAGAMSATVGAGSAVSGDGALAGISAPIGYIAALRTRRSSCSFHAR